MTAKNNLIQIGVAEVDITPDYPIRLSGYGSRREESDGIIQPIWAKALAIGDDTEDPVVLVTVENCGLPDELTEEVSRRMKEKDRDFPCAFRRLFLTYTQRAVFNQCSTVSVQYGYTASASGED